MDKKNLELLVNFIEREAQDYTPHQDDEWVLRVSSNAVKLIQDDANNSDYNFIINSHTNGGLLLRSLHINGATKVTTPLVINLCTCGAIEHMIINNNSEHDDYSEE